MENILLLDILNVHFERSKQNFCLLKAMGKGGGKIFHNAIDLNLTAVLECWHSNERSRI